MVEHLSNVFVVFRVRKLMASSISSVVLMWHICFEKLGSSSAANFFQFVREWGGVELKLLENLIW